MKAGRELDALIAEKVMGLIFRKRGGCPKFDDDVPHYSTRIQDAWLAVEKMWEIGCFHIALIQTDDGYECDFDDMRDTHSAAADTAPLAISLAALKAVE